MTGSVEWEDRGELLVGEIFPALDTVSLWLQGNATEVPGKVLKPVQSHNWIFKDHSPGFSIAGEGEMFQSRASLPHYHRERAAWYLLAGKLQGCEAGVCTQVCPGL